MRIFILTMILAMGLSHNAVANNTSNKVQISVTEEQSVQARIMDAFVSSFENKNNSKLTSLINELSSSYKKSGNSIFLYWQGYAMYYNSIIYLDKGDKDNAKKELNSGIEIVESIKDKNSEDHALLAMMYGFSCQFYGFPKVIQVSNKATKYIDLALELNKNNLRAYYVLGNKDFYTPKRFGGGKNTEKYLLKALSLRGPKSKGLYSPTWGRQESYELLVSHYIQKEDFAKARHYIELGLKEFPNSSLLQQNKSKLK